MRKNHSKIVCIKLVHLPYLHKEFFLRIKQPQHDNEQSPPSSTEIKTE